MSPPIRHANPTEGTRAKSRHWKTGFHHFALQAQAPIVMPCMDYPRKLSGLGPMFTPTGDAQADLDHIKAWSAQFNGKNWRQFDAR